MAIIIHRNDSNNAGDYWSRPSHYFKFDHKVIDIQGLKPFVTSQTIILGGGGLLGRPKWHNTIEEISKNNKVILWGAGHNNYPDNTKKSSLVGIQQESTLPSYMKNFIKVGLRDYGLGYDWVPCASCMHTAFDTAIKILPTKNILTISHNKIRIKTEYDNIQHIQDKTLLEEWLCHVAQYKKIITNTYHGAYWAMLLGKEVEIQSWSSKFNNMYFTKPNKNALQIAREANKKFFTCCEYLI